MPPPQWHAKATRSWIAIAILWALHDPQPDRADRSARPHEYRRHLRPPSETVNPTFSFHPAVAGWFSRSFAAPTAAQAEAWPAIQSGKQVLIAAPTGSGKTLAAFLAAIDGLVRQGL